MWWKLRNGLLLLVLALRLIARQRQKLVGQLASEKNRLHKVLTDKIGRAHV